MDLMIGIGYKAYSHAQKPTDLGRNLNRTGKVFKEVGRWAVESTPWRLVPWVAVNAAYIGPYSILATYSLIAKGYNAARGTQSGGRNADDRHWYNHWARLHLSPPPPAVEVEGGGHVLGSVPKPVLPRPGEIMFKELRMPDFHMPQLPPAPGDQKFDPNEKWSGMKDRSQQAWEEYNRWVSEVMAKDAEAIGDEILNETTDGDKMAADGTNARYKETLRKRFRPPGHDFDLIEVVANRILDSRNELDSMAGIEEKQTKMGELALSAAVEFLGNKDLTDNQKADMYRAMFEPQEVLDDIQIYTAHMRHLFSINTKNFNSVLQRDLERQEIEHVIHMTMKCIYKDLWYYAKYGYILGDDYKSAYKETADKAWTRLFGKTQEVDPVHGRVSTATIGGTTG